LLNPDQRFYIPSKVFVEQHRQAGSPWVEDRMFTLLNNGDQTEVDDLLDVLKLARPDEPVYVSGRGWMTVGDLRWEMTAGSDRAVGKP
jgi:hypothetical protein